MEVLSASYVMITRKRLKWNEQLWLERIGRLPMNVAMTEQGCCDLSARIGKLSLTMFESVSAPMIIATEETAPDTRHLSYLRHSQTL